MKKNIIILFLLIIVGVLSKELYASNKRLNTEKTSSAKEMFDLAVISPKRALSLYQLMKDFDEVMNLHKLDYWAQGGTILGAVRHQGIIPYDDDIDVEINEKDIEKIEPVLEDLKKLGYVIEDTSNDRSWIQIQNFDPCSKEECHLDIFVVKIVSNKIQYVNKSAQEAFASWDYFYESEIYPLKKYKFGDLMISGPNDAMTYLLRTFGKDAMTKGCIYPQHSNSAIKRRRCLTLEGEMLQPAKPTGPLLDRLKK